MPPETLRSSMPLTLREAAYLAGLIQAPEAADATTNTEGAEARQRSVVVELRHRVEQVAAQLRAEDVAPGDEAAHAVQGF